MAQKAEEITRGLATTSAKIRALAQAGFERAEIARLLGIRYQHVRRVLIDAGITGGLRRPREAEREPVAVPAIPAPREAVSCEVLLTAQFRAVGEWARGSEDSLVLNGTPPSDPGVYAFSVDDAVAYVGVASLGLSRRFGSYRRGHARQRTSARVKKLIQKTLSEGHRVRVFIAMPEPSDWNGLPVNTAAGLEAGLIQMIRPAWNIRGAGK